MLELSTLASFTTFCSRGTHYGTSSAATLLVENININSMSEIQDNKRQCFQEVKSTKVKLKDRSGWLPQ